MYKLEFTLKQHTPLIHFQHDQDGATLRATEVKPKLDKFIMEKLLKGKGKTSGNGFNEYRVVNNKEEYFDVGKAFLEYAKHHNPEWKEWLVGKGEHPALDYKLKLTDTSDLQKTVYVAFSSNEAGISTQIKDNCPDINEVLSNTPNFADNQYLKKAQGNLDVKRSKLNLIKRCIQFNDELKVNLVISFKTDLLNTIRENLQEFFLINNFGYRQSKGFGSYTITFISNLELKDPIVLLKNNFVTHKLQKNNINQVFSTIQETHKIIKSGINLRDRNGNQIKYQKAELFYEFASREIRWEKRYIKKQINQSQINDKNLFYFQHEPTDFEFDGDDIIEENSFEDLSSNSAPYKYIRALLGLAEHYEFLIDYNGQPDKNSKYYVSISNLFTDEKKRIDRFQSPILYKVINNCIYPMPKEIPDELWGKLFEFAYKLKDNNGNESAEVIMTDPLPIPNKKEFDLKEFLKDALNDLYKNCKI